MQFTKDKITNLIHDLPKEMLDIPNLDVIALETLYESINNLLQRNLTQDEVKETINEMKASSYSFETFEDKIPGFNEKLFEEYTNLIMQKVSITL